jgi:hypothetical protein
MVIFNVVVGEARVALLATQYAASLKKKIHSFLLEGESFYFALFA